MTFPLDGHDSLVPLLAEDDIAAELPPAWRSDLQQWGRIRHLTRAVAASRPTWQAVVRSEHMFATMTRIDRATQALVCLYVSLLNGCDYCVDDAAGTALAEGLTSGQLLAVHAPTAETVGARTRTILRYAYWVALQPVAVPADVTDELRRHIDDEQLLELTAVIAMKCFWNRFASALRLPPEGRCPDPDLLNALRELSVRLRDDERTEW
jgi:AhpD family alkylhydroperoxidase